jgi:hypothetical protein
MVFEDRCPNGITLNTVETVSFLGGIKFKGGTDPTNTNLYELYLNFMATVKLAHFRALSFIRLVLIPRRWSISIIF